MSRVKTFSYGIRQMIRQMAILGSVVAWIGCDRGVEVTPPAVTSEAGVAEASAIPNITSSIFQDQSFECLNEVYSTSQNVRQSAPFQKDFEKCRFLAVIAEEFLGGRPTNRGHVFSREALENVASDTFGEYHNEATIKPNSPANSDLSASQRARSDLSGRCSATEEIKVKRIEPTPGALRIVPPGCKDAAGNQPEYAFSLVFCCPKPVPSPTPTPAPSPTPTPAPSPLGAGVGECDPVALLRQADVSQLSGLNLGGGQRLSEILTNFANAGKASLVKTKIFFANGSFVETDLEVQGLELFSVETNLKTGQETVTPIPLPKDVIDVKVEIVFSNLTFEADDKKIPAADRSADTAKEVLAALIKSVGGEFPFADPQSLTGHVCNRILAVPSLHHTSFTKSFLMRDAAGNPDIKKVVQLNLLLSGFVRSCCPVSLLDQGVCAVIGEAGLPSILKGTERTFLPAKEISVATRPLSGVDLLATLPPFIQDAVRQNSEILFFVQKRFGADLNVKKLISGFEIEFLEKRSLDSTKPLSDLLTAEAKGFVFDAQGQIKASGGARSSFLPLEGETFLFTMMGVNGIEGIGIAFRNASTGKLNIKTLFFELQPSVLILAEQPPGFGGFTSPSIAFGCGNLKPQTVP